MGEQLQGGGLIEPGMEADQAGFADALRGPGPGGQELVSRGVTPEEGTAKASIVAEGLDKAGGSYLRRVGGQEAGEGGRHGGWASEALGSLSN